MPAMGEKTGAKWQARIEEAQKHRKEKLLGNVTRYLELYKGNHWGALGLSGRKDLITVNLTFPLIRNQVGFFYYRDPKMFVKPRDERSELTAPIVESALNYFWAECNARRQQRFRIYDTLIFGHSVGEIGWCFETSVVKRPTPERIRYDEYIRKDYPYIRRISPLRFGFDPKAEMDPITESEFVFKEFFRSVDDVKRDPRYSNTKALEAHLSTNDEEKNRYGEDILKLLEIHDRKHMKLLVFAQGFDRPLLDIDHPYEDILEGHNFEWLQFNHVPDEPYGISQVALMEDQQHELNRTRTQMFTHRRRVSNRRYLYDEGAIGDDAISKLENAEGGSMIPVGDINRIKPLEDARLSMDIPLIESVIKQDIRELTGQPAAQFGVIDNQARSATEMGQIASAADLRNADNLTLVEEDTRNCARKMVQVIKAFADRELIIKITGPKGAFWHKVTRDQIQGEYDTTIDPGSTTKESDPVRRKQATDLLAVVSKIPGANVREALMDVLKVYEVPRPERYWPAAPEVPANSPPLQPGAPAGPSGKIAQQSPPNAARIATDAAQIGPA